MRTSPSIAPNGLERDIYIVLDDFGRLGRAWRETDEAGTSRATLVRNLLEGQYENPVRVVAFNAAEGWSRHVTVDIADEFALTLSTPKCRDRFLRSSRPINRAEAVAALWWMVSQLETAPLATPSLVLH